MSDEIKILVSIFTVPVLLVITLLLIIIVSLIKIEKNHPNLKDPWESHFSRKFG